MFDALQLTKRVKLRVLKYLDAVERTTENRSTFKYGMKIPGKWDLEKAYLADMKTYVNIAKQFGDTKTLEFIQGCCADESEDIKKLKAEIASVELPQGSSTLLSVECCVVYVTYY